MSLLASATSTEEITGARGIIVGRHCEVVWLVLVRGKRWLRGVQGGALGRPQGIRVDSFTSLCIHCLETYIALGAVGEYAGFCG